MCYLRLMDGTNNKEYILSWKYITKGTNSGPIQGS